jgi:hypothetical protein
MPLRLIGAAGSGYDLEIHILGRELGARDHSTIVALDHRAHNLMNTFPDLFDRRQAILRRLGIG